MGRHASPLRDLVWRIRLLLGFTHLVYDLVDLGAVGRRVTITIGRRAECFRFRRFFMNFRHSAIR